MLSTCGFQDTTNQLSVKGLFDYPTQEHSSPTPLFGKCDGLSSLQWTFWSIMYHLRLLSPDQPMHWLEQEQRTELCQEKYQRRLHVRRCISFDAQLWPKSVKYIRRSVQQNQCPPLPHLSSTSKLRLTSRYGNGAAGTSDSILGRRLTVDESMSDKLIESPEFLNLTHFW